MNDGTALLEVRGLGCRFGAFRALSDVSLRVRRGEVLGLIGENGAGKSTLLNIVSGVMARTEGDVLVRGVPVAFGSYHEAAASGVFRVFQELALLPNLSVWENVYLGHETLLMRNGMIRRRAAIARTRELFRQFGHDWIDVTRTVGELAFAVQQIVEIMRAFALAELLGVADPIILLDEPTAGLSADEITFLQRLVAGMKSRSAIVFVSHRLTELLEWSDTIAILKDGQLVGVTDAGELSEQELHLRMVGRVREDAFYLEDRQTAPGAEVVLSVEALSDSAAFRDVSLAVHRGEIVGVAGVLGSGKTELGRAVFGEGTVTAGRIALNGRAVRASSARQAARSAIGYVPPERKEEGIIDTFSVMQNISISSIATQSSELLDLGREAEVARRFVARLGIRTRSIDEPISTLSGGNQQKAVLARWIARGVVLLILDNPTRGIDAGAKVQIYELLRELTRDGLSILLISDDLLEVIGLSNRIVVMKDKVVASNFASPAGRKPSESELVARMV